MVYIFKKIHWAKMLYEKKKTYKMKLVKRRYHRINMSVYIILKYSQYKLEALAKHIETHSEIFPWIFHSWATIFQFHTSPVPVAVEAQAVHPPVLSNRAATGGPSSLLDVTYVLRITWLYLPHFTTKLQQIGFAETKILVSLFI